jgi:hypothetical protein
MAREPNARPNRNKAKTVAEQPWHAEKGDKNAGFLCGVHGSIARRRHSESLGTDFANFPTGLFIGLDS